MINNHKLQLQQIKDITNLAITTPNAGRNNCKSIRWTRNINNDDGSDDNCVTWEK